MNKKQKEMSFEEAKEIIADIHRRAIDSNAALLSKVEVDIGKFKSAYELCVRLLEARKIHLQQEAREHEKLMASIYSMQDRTA